MKFFHDGDETVTIDGLLQVIGHAHGKAKVLIGANGEHDDGNGRQLGIRLQQRQDDPAVHFGHQDVEGDD